MGVEGRRNRLLAFPARRTQFEVDFAEGEKEEPALSGPSFREESRGKKRE